MHLLNWKNVEIDTGKAVLRWIVLHLLFISVGVRRTMICRPYPAEYGRKGDEPGTEEKRKTACRTRRFGRGDKIRTCDLLVPNQARYQTALHLGLEPMIGFEPMTCGLRNRCSAS